MSDSSPRTPAQRLSNILLWLCQAVTKMNDGNRLSYPMITLINERIRLFNDRFARLAARIADGTFSPRRFAPRRSPVDRRPPQPGTLPTSYGWVLPMVVDAVAFRAELERLLDDPAMAALLAAAPAPMARIVRPLCWMLAIRPPPILARTRRRREAAPVVTPPPPKQRPPKPLHPIRLPTQPTAPSSPVPARACGPPHPA